MTCYMRHMQWLFEPLGLESDKTNRKRVDAAIRDVLHIPADAHCPEVWTAIKSLSGEARAGLPAMVATYLDGDEKSPAGDRRKA